MNVINTVLITKTAACARCTGTAAFAPFRTAASLKFHYLHAHETAPGHSPYHPSPAPLRRPAPYSATAAP